MKPRSLTLVCLHGFLGRPEDWAQFVGVWTFGPKKKKVPLECPDLFSGAFAGLDLEAWARVWRPAAAGPKLLLGYSLGARAAMHCAVFSPDGWRGAIFLSGNPGLPAGAQDERRQRAARDCEWAHAFLYRPWEEVVARWNAQDVLRSSETVGFSRLESAFSRARVAEVLETWSVARQADLRVRLAGLDFPQLWLAGERDEKYVAFARAASRSEIVPGAGHRLAWDRPAVFVRIVQEFIDDIYEREEDV